MFAALIWLDDWGRKWRMKFNVKKCKLLVFAKTRRKPEVPKFIMWNKDKDAAEELERVKTFRYLGLHWQENAKWHHHFQAVVSSAAKPSYMICLLLGKRCPKLPIIRQLCHALIRSRLAYGMPVWCPPTKRGWKKLDTLVAGPMRRCLRLPQSTFLASVLLETRTLPMKDLYDLLLVRTARDAESRPSHHPRHDLYLEQVDHEERKVTVKCRAPLLQAAHQALATRNIDPLIDSRKLKCSFISHMRQKWRQSGKGKLLILLTPEAHDGKQEQENLPEYLNDPHHAAVIRAKLRFDRSDLRDTLARQRILPASEVKCKRCRVKENLNHLLFDCLRFGDARADLIRKAYASELLIDDTRDALRWILGDFSEVADVETARKISNEFLFAIDQIRPLYLT